MRQRKEATVERSPKVRCEGMSWRSSKRDSSDSETLHKPVSPPSTQNRTDLAWGSFI